MLFYIPSTCDVGKLTFSHFKPIRGRDHGKNGRRLEMEKLKELLGEDLFKQVAEKIGDTKKYIFGLDENYVSKDRFNQVNEQVKDFKSQLTERDKQLEELKKVSEGNEELQTKLAEMEANNAKIQEEYEARLTKSRQEYAIDLALTKAKAKNPKAVKALLDLEQIKLDDDKVTGLDEQLKALKESDGYLFDDEIPEGTGMTDSGQDEEKEDFTKEQALRIRQGMY